MKLSVVALAVVMSASAQTGPSGHWEGTTPSPQGPTKVSLDIAQKASGEWIGSLGVPEMKVTGLRLANLEVKGNSVSFVSIETPHTPTFDLDLTGGKLQGMIRSGAGEIAVEFTRTGEAKVELPVAVARVSKALAGDWVGSLALPDSTRTVLLHFANRDDGTALATMDSPANNLTGALLEKVSEQGRDVSFSLRIYGGSYKGTMNEKGTQIVGDWTQSPSAKPLPITFLKK